jgi:hypothetical protein
MMTPVMSVAESNCSSFPPKLEISHTGLEFTDESINNIKIKNSGGCQLTWTVSSGAQWVFVDNQRLADYPIGSSITQKPLEAGEEVEIGITSRPVGLPTGERTNETLVVSSTAGTKALPIKLTVTKPDFSGLWVGYLKDPTRPALGLPGIALYWDLNSYGGLPPAAFIDASLAPAFATRIEVSPSKPKFIPSEGSQASGLMDFSCGEEICPAPTIPETAIGIWSLVALDAQTFELRLNDVFKGELKVDLAYSDPDIGFITVKPSLSRRSYHPGDRFEFEVGHFGVAVGALSQVNATTYVGEFTIDAELSPTNQMVRRRIELKNLEIVAPNRLRGDFSLIHKGVLLDHTMQISGIIELFREP